MIIDGRVGGRDGAKGECDRAPVHDLRRSEASFIHLVDNPYS